MLSGGELSTGSQLHLSSLSSNTMTISKTHQTAWQSGHPGLDSTNALVDGRLRYGTRSHGCLLKGLAQEQDSAKDEIQQLSSEIQQLRRELQLMTVE